ALAGWPGNALLHACSRSPPSRAGVYARASARIPVAEPGGVRDVELGKAVERSRELRVKSRQSRAESRRAAAWSFESKLKEQTGNVVENKGHSQEVQESRSR